MDFESAIISKVIETQDIVPALEAKVSPDWFHDPYEREVWAALIEHHREYGQVPSLKALSADFPDYEVVEVPEPMQFYIDRMARGRQFELLSEGLSEAITGLDSDMEPQEIIDVLSAMVTRTNTEVSVLRDTNLVETWEARLQRYADMEKNRGALTGIPTGFRNIDQALNGIQPEQLVTLVGLPKAGKSWSTLSMAITAHDYGFKPLFIGFEMSNQEQEERYDALVANISYGRLRRGMLTEEEKERLRKSMRKRRRLLPFVVSSDINSATTASGVAAKIEQYRPDIVFIDGVYMMDDEQGEPKGSPQALTNLTRSLKRLCQKQKVPIICSTQALSWKVGKRGGLKADSIGYSSSFVQDSDVVIGVETVDEEDPDVKRMKIILSRASALAETYLRWELDEGKFIELEDPSDIPDETIDGSAL